LAGWESVKAIRDWLKPLAKRGDTYLLAVSLVTLSIAARFYQRYQDLPPPVIALLVVAVLAASGALAYTRSHPSATAWRTYASTATIWLGYFIFIDAIWPFLAAPIFGYAGAWMAISGSKKNGATKATNR